MQRFAAVFWIVISFWPLSGCSNDSADEYLARGEASLAAGDQKAALIEFKNAVQQAPDLAQARILLGSTHARLGEWESSLREFERAKALDGENPTVLAGMLRAKVRIGRHREVIEALADRGDLTPEFSVLLGRAYLADRQYQRAEPLLLAGKDLAEGALGLAELASARGDKDLGIQEARRAAELAPDDADAWLLIGELALRRDEQGPAEEAFQQAAALPAGVLSGGLGIARVRLSLGDLEGAEAQVGSVLKIAPDYPLAHYLQGVIQLRAGETEAAEASIREVQKVAPDHPPSLYVMAAIKQAEGQLAQAQDQAQRYLAREPDDPAGLKLLAYMLFQQGKLAEVVDLLNPLLETSDDPQLLALLGSAQLRLGRSADAVESYTRAVELAPDATVFRNQLAVSLVAGGEQGEALQTLKQAIDLDGESIESEYLLLMVQLGNDDLVPVEKGIAQLRNKWPNSPLPYHLEGLLAQKRGDPGAAETAFRGALSRDSTFVPAAQALAKLALEQGDVPAARTVVEQLLTANPDNDTALRAIALIRARDGDVEGATRLLERAVATNPDSIRSRAMLSRIYFEQGRLDQAGPAIDQGLERASRDPELLLLKSDLQLRRGDASGAAATIAVLQQQLDNQPKNAELRRQVGTLQLQLGKLGDARANLEEAVALGGDDDPRLLEQLVRLDLAAGDPAGARKRFAALQKSGYSGDDARALEADLLGLEGKTDEAEALYNDLLESGRRSALIRLHALDMQRNQTGPAAERLRQWLAKYPDDQGVRLRYADVLMKIDGKTAIDQYEKLQASGNPAVLNNLAWLYFEQADPRAPDLARQALAVAPDNPSILDTVGWILVNTGSEAEGLGHLQRSVAISGDNPTVLYHLASVLASRGSSAEARTLLERALSMPAFPEAAQARALLEGLGL